MKNLMKSVLVAATVGLFSVSASAVNQVSLPMIMVQDSVDQDTVKKDVPETPLYLAQNEVTYSKIEMADLPQVVKSAVMSKYAAYSIEEAFKGSDGLYKLVLKNEEANLTVYYNEAGEFQKEDTVKKAEQILVLI